MLTKRAPLAFEALHSFFGVYSQVRFLKFV